ncbi:MAG TPA: lysine 2,3-aminomutase, partial [Nitrospira sp.]|nr:lysine 2,3-aminomutase [Nitrospira sp.]
VNLDEDSAVLRNYENNTYHYPQPGSTHGRELPMVGAHPSWG